MTVTLDEPGREETTLEGHVVVTYDRFRLTSEKLSVKRAPSGVEIDGAARLALCPCEDPPVSIGVSGAKVSASGDVTARFPRLYIGPVPIFALPWLLVRPADRPGLLPPFVSVRGADGLLLGAGARLPWRGADARISAIELRAAGYPKGGFELDARFDTTNARGKIVWDRLRTDRFVVETRGFVRTNPRESASMAWDLDAIRGARGLVATPSIEAAARPFDVGVAETSVVMGDSGKARLAGAAGVWGRALRGEGKIVWGPMATIATSGALFTRGAFEANALFTTLADAGGATPIGRAEAAIEVHPKAGPLALEAALRGRTRIAAPAAEMAISWDAVLDARTTARLPLTKVFPHAPGLAPIVHRIAPLLEARIFAAATKGSFFQTNVSGESVLAVGAAGLSSSIGRAFGPTLDVEARAGLAAAAEGIAFAGWASVSGSNEFVETRVELDASEVVSGRVPSAGAGLGALAEARIGRLSGGPVLALSAAGRTNEAGTLARSLGPAGPFPMDAAALVAGRGLSLGAGTETPLGRALRASAAAAVDARAATLAFARASLRYRHPEGCAAIELGASYRVGRPGVDFWLLFDLFPPLGAAAPAAARALPGRAP